MLTPEQFKALQIVNEVASDLQELNHLDVSNYKVRLNASLEHCESLKYAFNILGISYQVFSPSIGVKPDENNAIFDSDISPQVIYYLTYLLNKFFKESNFCLYICYANSSDTRTLETLLGSYITHEKGFFNVSRRISTDEFLALDVNSLTSSSIHELFPNIKYDSSGECTTHVVNDDDYDTGGNYDDDDNSWGSNYDNEYYDDNLDMDQQSQEYWDNL
jgi:hypothetical protein